MARRHGSNSTPTPPRPQQDTPSCPSSAWQQSRTSFSCSHTAQPTSSPSCWEESVRSPVSSPSHDTKYTADFSRRNLRLLRPRMVPQRRQNCNRPLGPPGDAHPLRTALRRSKHLHGPRTDHLRLRRRAPLQHPTKWLTTIFVLNDVVCFLTQLAGAGVQITGDPHVMAIGKKAVLAGLIFALVVFGVFVWVAAAFHRRLDAEPTAVVRECPRLRWKKYMWVIYVSCGMLMVRNLVRTVQFGSRKGSALNTEEAFIYVFDAALMAGSILVLIVWHPGRLVRRAQKATKASQMCVQMEDAPDIPLTGYREG